MSYESNLQGSAVKTAVNAIPVIGGILAGLLPADIGNDWTAANAIWAAWMAKVYRGPPLSRRTLRGRMQFRSRGQALRGRVF